MEKSLLEEYRTCFRQRSGNREKGAKEVAFALLDELIGRKGFDDVWDSCDNDVKEEILNDLVHRAQPYVD